MKSMPKTPSKPGKGGRSVETHKSIGKVDVKENTAPYSKKAGRKGVKC